MPALADRMDRAEMPATLTMTIKSREMRAKGIPVISLAIGEPDFFSPRHAIEAGYQAALRGETKYPPIDGVPALKQAIQRKFQRDSGLDYALSEICVGHGGKGVIWNVLMATVNEGDEVVIPAPYWGAYPLMAQVVGGTPVFVNCPQNNGFKLRPEDLDASITPRTKLLMLNNPNNPTGAALSAEEMQALAEVMRRHKHVWILCDDMYEHLVYDGFHHATMAQVAPDLRDRVLTCSGVSKTYAMTGWRVGFAGGPKPLIDAMVNLQGQAGSGISTVGQAAAAAALDGPQDLAREMAAAYCDRRELVVDALNNCPGMVCHRPEGAFYVYPGVAGLLGKTTSGGKRLDTDEDVALALLEEAQVAVVHGAAFGMSPYLRISYATGTDDLREAMRRIQDFCRRLT